MENNNGFVSLHAHSDHLWVLCTVFGESLQAKKSKGVAIKQGLALFNSSQKKKALALPLGLGKMKGTLLQPVRSNAR
jgi:hypothetical protein